MTEAILKELLNPANRIILDIVLIALAVILLFLMGLAVYLAKTGKLHASTTLGPVRIQLSPASSTDDLERKAAGYRKLLYIKVTHLTERTPTALPVYTRTIDRLEPSERLVPVFDEAVYYTLELFPTSRTVEPRTDSSSGAIDPRMVIPWQDQIRFHEPSSRAVARLAQMDIDAETDTVLTISHFENGLQGDHQDFMTFIAEDAEDARLVVDFSSIPRAESFVSLRSAFLDCKAGNTSRPVGISPIAPALFAVSTKEAKKGDVLRLCVNINWAAHPASNP